MKIHSDWATRGFDRPPLSADVGPFPQRAMLEVWWQHLSTGEVHFVETDGALLPIHVHKNTIKIAGEADLFDYHSPLGSEADLLAAEWAETLDPGWSLDLDSLPGDAADAIMSGLSKAGLNPTAHVHESAAVLELPDDYEIYLAELDKKQRHETRRKHRRFVEALGEPRIERAFGATAVAQFAEMHHKAAGDKGTFMTEEMEAYFLSLNENAGALVDFLYADHEAPVAAAFGFEDDSSFYLYNSAYDTAAAAASPGIVLVSELIRRTIEDGRSRFDFLKGDEVYKYRLGAEARPLWRVTATTGVQA
ncbi:MAG: GNAT family N-acetyltransferase [Acidimicrobiia bacterium]|nr:GNAT family N-acetyltransferase [Acidimicrobiia bacterium]